jgi:peptidyl-prolyl cis-trans isomerase SurA
MNFRFSALCLLCSAVHATVLSAPAQAAPVILERLEAAVNQSLILQSDLSRFRKTTSLRAQLDPLFAGTPVAEKGEAASTDEIIRFLIDEALISQAFEVTDGEVETEINSILAGNRLGRDQLKDALKSRGFRFEDYFELIRISVSKRNLIDRDIRTKVTISDDDVKNYFYNHYAKKSEIPASYKLKLIHVNPANYRSPEAARETAERALREIRGGEAFEEVAKRVSDDPSAQSNADFGTFSADQMAPLVRQQIAGLQLGQVSPVFGDAKAGYFILKIIDILSGENDRLDRMKEEIRGQIAAGEYQRQIQLWLDRQRQVAYIHLAGK